MCPIRDDNVHGVTREKAQFTTHGSLVRPRMPEIARPRADRHRIWLQEPIGGLLKLSFSRLCLPAIRDPARAKLRHSTSAGPGLAGSTAISKPASQPWDRAAGLLVATGSGLCQQGPRRHRPRFRHNGRWHSATLSRSSATCCSEPSRRGPVGRLAGGNLGSGLAHNPQPFRPPARPKDDPRAAHRVGFISSRAGRSCLSQTDNPHYLMILRCPLSQRGTAAMKGEHKHEPQLLASEGGYQSNT